MDNHISEAELRGVDRFLEEGHRRQSFLYLLPFFWGAIALKCVLAEWLMLRYTIPVNFVWVWLPSLSLGVVATALYGRILWKGFTVEPPTQKWDFAVWVISGVFIVIITVLGFLSQSVAAYDLPLWWSAVLTVAFCVHAWIEKQRWYALMACAWLIVSLFLFFLDSKDNLLWFALALSFFVVIPFFVRWRLHHRKKQW